MRTSVTDLEERKKEAFLNHLYRSTGYCAYGDFNYSGICWV